MIKLWNLPFSTRKAETAQCTLNMLGINARLLGTPTKKHRAAKCHLFFSHFMIYLKNLKRARGTRGLLVIFLWILDLVVKKAQQNFYKTFATYCMEFPVGLFHSHIYQDRTCSWEPWIETQFIKPFLLRYFHELVYKFYKASNNIMEKLYW